MLAKPFWIKSKKTLSRGLITDSLMCDYNQITCVAEKGIWIVMMDRDADTNKLPQELF